MISDERLDEILAGLDRLPHGPWFCNVADGQNGTAGLAQVDNGAEMWPVIAEWHEAQHIARCDPDTMRSLVTELKSLRASRPAEGEVEPVGDWVMVPREPTEAMLRAGSDASWRKLTDMASATPTEHPEEGGGPFGYAYRAMLSATPTPPAPVSAASLTDGGYEFDRYIDGVLMAEGVSVKLASTAEAAMIKAASLASRGTKGKMPVLVLRAPTLPISPAHGVKELEWEPIRANGGIWWQAPNPLGGLIEASSIEERERKQADFDQRIRSCLTTPANSGPAEVTEGWQDISTAPKDGTEILTASAEGLVRIGFWDVARGNIWSAWPGRAPLKPSYWRPVPALTAALNLGRS